MVILKILADVGNIPNESTVSGMFSGTSSHPGSTRKNKTAAIKSCFGVFVLCLSALPVHSTEGKYCQRMGTFAGQPVIHSLGQDDDLINCVSFSESSSEITSVFISFPAALTQQLPAIPVDPAASPMVSADGLPFSDHTICNFKYLPSDETCAKGYRAFGELPDSTTGSAFRLTLVSWDNFGLYDWHPGLRNRQLGFHFYYNTSYDELISIHPGWSSDNIHVEPFSNAVVQRPLQTELIPQNYLSTGSEGARAGVGGIMIDRQDICPENQKSHFLLWGYSDSRTTFIRPTFTQSAFREIQDHCTLDGIDGIDGYQQTGSGNTPQTSFLQPCRKAQWCFPIKQPEAYPVKGLYPRTYCVKYDIGNTFENRVYEFTVQLKDFRESRQLPTIVMEAETNGFTSHHPIAVILFLTSTGTILVNNAP